MKDDTSCVKEDFVSLKNHLNIAARIELQVRVAYVYISTYMYSQPDFLIIYPENQTNEKMYENRLHHLEKMLEEMRHREESFLHIAEETNILKDQVTCM